MGDTELLCANEEIRLKGDCCDGAVNGVRGKLLVERPIVVDGNGDEFIS